MADTLDVVTLAEAKTALGVKAGSTDQDGKLAQYITAVSRRLDQACGAVVSRTVTGERHNGGAPSIFLRHPVSAFTSVTEYQVATPVTLTAETLGTAPSDGYYAEKHDPDPTLGSGRVWRRTNGWDGCFYPGRDNIAVTYTAGRFGSSTAVDSRFKGAAYIMLRNLWATTEPTIAPTGEFQTPGGRFPTFAVPKAARELLADEWREVPGIA